MLTKGQAWFDSEGTPYKTLEEAQRRDVFRVVSTGPGFESWPSEKVTPFVDHLIEHSEILIAALTTGPRSRPRARKAAGTTNPQRAVARVNLQLTLADIRRVTGWTDDEIITHIGDRSVKKVRGIGEAKFSVLQEWAAGQGMAKMGFAKMREAANDPSLAQGTDVPATPPVQEAPLVAVCSDPPATWKEVTQHAKQTSQQT